MMGWIWIGIIALAIIVEVVTDQMVSVWFVPGGIVAIILNFFEVDLVWQILAFLLISALGIVLFKCVLGKKLVNNKNTKTNIDAIIGERCVVTEKIDNFAGCGQARVGAQIWSARGASEDDVFEVGEILNVVAIEGVKLICKK